MNKNTIGALEAILCFWLWGLFPIYFKLTNSVNAFEVLAHRIIWSVVLMLIVLIITKQIYNLKNIMTKSNVILMFFGSVALCCNWLTFIYAVSTDRVLETSLGYYITPIVFFVFGVVFFQDKANIYSIIAVVLAILAILYQFVQTGYIPLFSIIIALSWSIYGVIRKNIKAESLSSIFLETLLMCPFAIAFIIYLFLNDNLMFFSKASNTISIYLIFAAFLTTPLFLFTSASKKISFSSIGFLQYITPSVSFAIAIWLYKEPFNEDMFVVFLLIWSAVLVFSWNVISKWIWKVVA